MSLINEVLRDLDTRHAAESERKGLDENIRALPQVPVRPWRKLAPLMLAACAGGAAVWLWLQPTMPPAAPPVVSAPVDTPAPLAAAPLEPATQTEPRVDSAPALRLDTDISAPPKPALASPPPAPKAIAPVVTAAAKPVAAPAPAPTAKPATAAPAPHGAPHISKQASDGSGGTQAEQAEAEYRRGYAALRRGVAAEAGEAFRAALKLQSGHVNARQALLALLTEQKQWQDVEVLALDGVGIYPQRSDWAMLAARIIFERGDAAGALDTLQQHAAGARQNPDYQIFHALLLQRANRYAEAVTCYQLALAVRPSEGRWWYGLGRALDADRREAEARQAYEKARDSGNLPPDLAQIVDKRLR